MRRRAGLAGLAAVCALVIPAPASAVYQPKLTLSLDRTGPAQAPAVTSSMTQGFGESPTKTIAARFPPGVTLNPNFNVVGCSAADEQARSCPESSRLGSASVRSSLGPAAGPVYLTEDFRVWVALRALGPLYESRITGRVTALDDGSAEIVFDNLPAIPIYEASIRLDGGSRGIFITPRTCGRYTIGGRLVSWSDEVVSASFPLEIRPCAVRPRISRIRIAPKRVAPGKRPKLSWRLSRAALRTHIKLFRAGDGVWREVASARAPAAAGRNVLRLPRRWKGRLERPARYRLVLRARAAGGLISRARGARFRVIGG